MNRIFHLEASMRTFFISLLAAVSLAACGGSDGGSAGTDAQAKAMQRVQKSQASDYQDAVQALYISYFGRPADPIGLINFETALANAGAPTDLSQLCPAAAGNPAIEALLASFGTSAESQKLYGSVSGTGGNVQDFVKAVFQNVFNRAPQSAGLVYWSNAIASGSLSQGDAALSIMTAALSNNTAQGQLDAQLIRNRISVAGYFTSQVQQQGKTTSYTGSSAASSARAVLGAVTASTVVSDYENGVQNYVAAMSSASANVLTYGLQNVSASGSSNGGVSGTFTYDWGNTRITAFAFNTPLGNFSSMSGGNSATITTGNGSTTLTFANAQNTLTLVYPGTPGVNDIGFFSGALCTTTNVCTVAGKALPVSALVSSVWSSDPVWVPDLEWESDMVWVPNVVWVSNWVWVSDWECTATDDDGNCTQQEDDGYYEDDGGYVDQGGYVDEGSYVDEGGYVDQGGYPSDNLIGGLTVLVP